MTRRPADVVAQYWDIMRSNDFMKVADLLAEDFICVWPQSRELIRGAETFRLINADYPPDSRWTFDVERAAVDGRTVVTDTLVSDGKTSARVITFFTVANDRIIRMHEYWPDDYPAPSHRRHLVEPWPAAAV